MVTKYSIVKKADDKKNSTDVPELEELLNKDAQSQTESESGSETASENSDSDYDSESSTDSDSSKGPGSKPGSVMSVRSNSSCSSNHSNESFDDEEIMQKDALYYILSKFFLSSDGTKNIVDVLMDIQKKLK